MGTITAKYCMAENGKFVMISKYSGMDHGQLSLLLEHEPVSAGFVVEQGASLIAYGQSMTLDLKSREADTQIIMDALLGGHVRTTWDDVFDQWYAGTIDHIHVGDVTSLADMQEKRIV